MTVPVPDFPDSRSALPPPGTDPEWFKRAVFYEVLVRGFADSNADGIGDLRGMIGKLDYLQWLGVDCSPAPGVDCAGTGRVMERGPRSLSWAGALGDG